ncbi:MAG: endonuclease III [Erysipelotrichaceae bacterium]|nr:endonuclease III [Erysipelotrichaceae bacterium]
MKPHSAKYISEHLQKLFPDAHCELNYRNGFELLVAVVLSAQTTDVSVNKVTSELFVRYPDAKALSEANRANVEAIIRRIGLYRMKANNIIELSKKLVSSYDGEVPSERKDLENLPGVGRKTANVVLAEYFHQPAFAVDTHVSRVAARLGIAEEGEDPLAIEKKLCEYFPKKDWHRLHHSFIFFGRYFCTARNPKCGECPFQKKCRRTTEEK